MSSTGTASQKADFSLFHQGLSFLFAITQPIMKQFLNKAIYMTESVVYVGRGQ